MKAAVIKDGKVVNHIIVNSLDILPGLVDAGDSKIGDSWDGESFATSELLLSTMLSDLKAQREKIEFGGIILSGVGIDTSRAGRIALSECRDAFELDPTRIIDFKAESGWVTIDKATFDLIAPALADHVQACFTREKELSITLATDINTDITTGWSG